jgi:hypothetical protein
MPEKPDRSRMHDQLLTALDALKATPPERYEAYLRALIDYEEEALDFDDPNARGYLRGLKTALAIKEGWYHVTYPS